MPVPFGFNNNRPVAKAIFSSIAARLYAPDRLVQDDEFDASQANFTPPAPGSVEGILTAHDSTLRVAQEYLGGLEQAAQGYSVAVVCPIRNTRMRRYRSRYLEAWLAPRSQWEPGRWRHYQWPDYPPSSGSHIR